ncbi:polysaccharide pyruvyl transferase family protein [Phormidium tenue]|uniref:Polysaccharide pyruvyl transferase domain-containing protein n=1 Tax=Phormidium tenue NIES-30 TaxID=549789 RepID=A0A1U7J6B6_9CYAN|nr:polysaccharide pyruvyl transferase family protein [Phormidium tenue]MBD2231995.1 polysaccharide pyruvyl transferase family protein [Phormidium tenue FACHB-1052]OKH48409.1 hypothetical protein NIES30_10315 [Phormidium tenue NIES-30]
MKLYYFKKKEGNFGDDLNDWLWRQFFPNTFDEDDSVVFFGIGTIINDRIYDRAPNAKKIIIFGSGVGYGKTPLKNLPIINEKWSVYCLRGPLSSNALGLEPEKAVTDGAILIRRLFKPHKEKVYKFSYMPHVDQAEKHAHRWQSICQKIGFGFIDPRWQREDVLNTLCQTEILITEAMHGAIVADALRIPWIPVKTARNIFEFKWWDWCVSVGLHYEPRLMQGFSEKKNGFLVATEWMAEKAIINQFMEITKSPSPFLSKESKVEQLTIKMEEAVEYLRKDISSGIFSN